MPGTRISLDHPALAGRTRIYQRRRSTYERRSVVGERHRISDIRPAAPVARPVASPAQPKAVHPVAKSAPGRTRRSKVLRRQGLSAPGTRVQSKGFRRRRGGLRTTVLTAFATLLFLVGMGVGGLQLVTNHKVKAQVAALTTTQGATAGAAGSAADSDAGLPSEDNAGSIANYHVAARLPRVLRITRIGVEARVIQVDVDAKNQLRAPSSIFDAGWYKGSALPGDSGAVLLDGHVHGPTKAGVFAGLKKLKPGDKLSIERGDGKVFNYHVVKSQSYAKDAVDMGAAFSSVTPGKPGLNLITCDGSYDASGEYNNRLIVFAVQD